MGGKDAQYQHKKQAHDECQHTAHQTVNNHRSRAKPRFCQRPYNLPQNYHLGEVNAEGAHAQQGPTGSTNGMSLAVITLRGEMSHDNKQKCSHGDIVDADVTGNGVDMLWP